MVEVNGAHNHGRYETIQLKSLRQMSNVYVFAMPRWPASQTQLKTTEIHDTHMDQKQFINFQMYAKFQFFFYAVNRTSDISLVS